VVELDRAGHDVTLVCKKSSQARVIQRAKETGIERLETLHLASGVSPILDVRDLRRLIAWLPETQVFHVHRGKEHWLAALANRKSNPRRAVVRTRHIVQPIRPHALNRWLYGSATDLVVTVTDAIRRQIVASGLAPEDRVVALPGGVDAERYRPELPPVHGVDAHLWPGLGQSQRDCNCSHDLKPVRPNQRQPLLRFPQFSFYRKTDCNK